MWSKLLFATDGSDFSETGLRKLADLAVRLSASVDVVHLVDIRHAYVPMVPLATGGVLGDVQVPTAQMDSLRATILDEGRRVIERARAMLKQIGIEGEATLIEGPVVPGILEKAKEYDLLGIGKKGWSHGWSDNDVGSTMERVLRRANVPILVTAGRPRRIEKVLWAYDASPCSERMIDVVPLLCERLKIPVTLLSVSEKESAMEQGARHLEAPARAARNRGVETHIEMVTGYPEEEILHFAAKDDYTMIAMGAYGHHRLVDFFLGSVARVVVRRSEVPVLFLR